VRRAQSCGTLALMILVVVPAARPQPSPQEAPGFANPFDNPTIRKYWNPVVGTGAVFAVTQPNGKTATTEYDILSSEKVDSK
jgi:hypothetical protein